jgi:RecA/RadA recombinase
MSRRLVESEYRATLPPRLKSCKLNSSKRKICQFLIQMDDQPDSSPSQMPKTSYIEVIPTGSLLLDLALGIGGIPGGQFIELCGPEASGKTTLSQHILAEAQKKGAAGALIDTDHTFDPAYARRCGVNLDRLVICEPETAEQAL